MTRRQLLRTMGGATFGAAALTVAPAILEDPRWATAASAQTPPTVEAAFVALVAAVNGLADDADGVPATAAWIVVEFDKALPPLPAPAASSAVAAVLDAYALQAAGTPSFAAADTEGRHATLEAMVKDPDPAIRQLANQVLPFAAFAYWGGVVLEEPAVPDGPRPPQWDVAGYLGPSHGRSATYRDGGPDDFVAHGHGEL